MHCVVGGLTLARYRGLDRAPDEPLLFRYRFRRLRLVVKCRGNCGTYAWWPGGCLRGVRRQRWSTESEDEWPSDAQARRKRFELHALVPGRDDGLPDRLQPDHCHRSRQVRRPARNDRGRHEEQWGVWMHARRRLAERFQLQRVPIAALRRGEHNPRNDQISKLAVPFVASAEAVTKTGIATWSLHTANASF